MTLPSIVPTGRKGDYRDFLQTKCNRDGDPRVQGFTTTIPASTVVTTIAGFVPFNKGARLVYSGSQVATSGLGASVTVDLGYVYFDNVTYTNDPDAFGSAVAAASAGAVNFDEPVTGISWVAEADGWIVATISGATTTATPQTLIGQIELAYDGLNLSN